MKVGYQGVSGAYSEAAIKMYFEGMEYEEVCYSDFVDMMKDVDSGSLDYAMFPVENTTTGIIARTYDYFQYYNVHAVGEVVVPIRHNLITLPGARLEDIKEVYSHPEALSQCHEFFRAHPQMKAMVYEDTALSVRYIKDLGDKGKAALASSLAAEIYDMPVLLSEVQDSDYNMTRFLLMTNKPAYPENADKISIRMVTGHVPGALFNALGVFSGQNVNVLKLESRPIPGKVFEYCFYLDFAGNLNDPVVEEVLRRLRFDCLELSVFGNYKSSELAL